MSDALSILLSAVLAELGEELQGNEPVHDLLQRLIRRYRGELDTLQAAVDEAKARHLALLTALEQVAVGEAPDLSQLGEDSDVVAALADHLSTGKHLNDRARQAETERDALKRRLIQVEKERDDALREAALKAAEGTAEARLERYRQAFAELAKGGDPSEDLEAIREIERVFPLSPAQQGETQKLLERALDTLASALMGLRKLIPDLADPKRFRSGLLKSSPYRLKTLAGLITACSDATKDVATCTAVARRAHGGGKLTKGMAALRPALEEMVRFVADVKTQVAKDKVLSITLDLGTATGLGALPANLAADCQSLLARPAGRKRADELLPLFKEILEHYEELLKGTLGDDLPPPPEPPKRKPRPAKALEMAADRMAELARAQAMDFADLAAREWEPTSGEARILADPDLLHRAAREVSTMVEILAKLPGARPTDDLVDPMDVLDDAQALDEQCQAHSEWMAEAAKYRVQLLR